MVEMPERFIALSDYNYEVSQGNKWKYSVEYQKLMTFLQADFEKWRRKTLIAEGFKEINEGVWQKETPKKPRWYKIMRIRRHD